MRVKKQPMNDIFLMDMGGGQMRLLVATQGTSNQSGSR
jgi:hypothetical protein